MYINSRQSMIIVALLLLGFFAISFGFLNSQSRSIPTAMVATTVTPTPEQASRTSASTQAPIQATIASLAGELNGQTKPVTTDPAKSSPEVEITNFKRSENKDGKLAWELAGSSAKYAIGGSEIVIRDADIKTRLASGELANLKTPEAVILMSGTMLNEASGKGGVSITLDSGITLKTQSARFERVSGKVSSPDQITILHRSGSLTGDSFQGDTNKQLFVFTGNVHTTILPRKK